MDGSPVKNGHRRVEAMLELQNHRGPDDKGVVLSDDGCLALGNVRLAIVDAKRKLPVPFKKSDSGDMLSFNGEIYNFFELRRELEKKGKNLAPTLTQKCCLRQSGFSVVVCILDWTVSGLLRFITHKPGVCPSAGTV